MINRSFSLEIFFVCALGIKDKFVKNKPGETTLAREYDPLPFDEELTIFLVEIGFDDDATNLGDIKKDIFPVPWCFDVHYVIRSLAGKTGDTDAIVKDLLKLL